MKNTKDEIIKKIITDQKIRFLVVGCVNTIVGYSVFAFLIFVGLQYLLANLIATTVGVITSYFLNKYFTFKKHGKSIFEILRFGLVYLLSFALSNFILYILIDLLSISPYKAGATNLIFVTIISWYGHKNFSFKDKTQKG